MSSLSFIKNGRLYNDKLTGDNNLHIFNIPLTNVYLNKFEEEIQERVTFHEIVSLTLFKNGDMDIVLPDNLKYLYMKSGILRTLNISDNVAANIETIILDYTNLEVFPDISKCNKLRELTINHSNLSSLELNYTLPKSLQVLNLRYNNIRTIDTSIFTSHPNLKINLSFNHLSETLIAAILLINPKAILQMQNSYKFNKINYNNYNAVEIQHFMNGIRPVNPQINTENNGLPKQNVLTNNTQTVHLSSINTSIQKSFNSILQYIESHKLVVNNNYDEVTHQFIWSLEKSVKHSIEDFFKTQILEVIKHSMLDITYMQLFCIVWSIVNKHEQRENLIERLYTEIKESIGFCFTGRMNRLINVLVGYIDGVVVSISLKEEVQMAIEKVMNRLISQKIDYKTAKEEFITILNYNYEVDTDDKNNIISQEYKDTWINALKDYRPDPIMCKFHDFVHPLKDAEINPYYYISYDDLIYIKEEHFEAEKYAVGEIVNKEKWEARIYSYEFKGEEYPEKYMNYFLI
jgi:hypothetical protein